MGWGGPHLGRSSPCFLGQAVDTEATGGGVPFPCWVPLPLQPLSHSFFFPPAPVNFLLFPGSACRALSPIIKGKRGRGVGLSSPVCGPPRALSFAFSLCLEN